MQLFSLTELAVHTLCRQEFLSGNIDQRVPEDMYVFLKTL